MVQGLNGTWPHDWVVRSIPERAVRVRALAGNTVLCSRHIPQLSQCLSPPSSINRYRRIDKSRMFMEIVFCKNRERGAPLNLSGQQQRSLTFLSKRDTSEVFHADIIA